VTEGVIFNIQRYSIHDGPGIRSVVFMKGCPLRCEWCSNPEGQGLVPEMEFYSLRCQRCGRCVEVCPRGAVNRSLDCPPAAKVDRQACDLCGVCVEACPFDAWGTSGRRVTVEEVVAEVKKDVAFYRKSGGGVTLSGGEPLVQPSFVETVVKRLGDANIHTAIETCGHAPEQVFRQVVESADLVLYDVKHADPWEHQRLTGVSNERVLDNLRALVGMGKPIVVRVPLIPGWNDTEVSLRAMGALVSSLGIREVHLMPFHQLGKDKYPRLGKRYELADLPPLLGAGGGGDGLAVARSVLESFGLKVQVGG
jgi:glycyl-radical enzyme activating protein